jgi:LysE type translocator.
VIAIFWLLNALILVVLAIWTIRQSKISPENRRQVRKRLRKHNLAFVIGFLLAITNPLMIVWWLLGARLLIDVGLIVKYTTFETFLFLGIGGLGIGSYLSLLAFIVLKVKRFVSEKGIQKITSIFGVVLLGLAVYITASSAIVLMS